MATESRFSALPRTFGLRSRDALLKRSFDVALSLTGLIFTGWLILILIVFARFSTGASGVFRQRRVGLYGDVFTLYKLRTMRAADGPQTTVTTATDARITPFGAFLRRTKLDELPQLANVLKGEMSFVGPRPDVPEMYAGLDRPALRVLTIRPGITGPASLHFRREEDLLASVENPEAYNRNVIFPEKIRLNLNYIDNYSLALDLRIIVATIFGGVPDSGRKQST